MFSTQSDPSFKLSKFLSRSLKDAETRCPAIEGEATTTLWAIVQSQADIINATTNLWWEPLKIIPRMLFFVLAFPAYWGKFLHMSSP